jgi:hypothetical protein
VEGFGDLKGDRNTSSRQREDDNLVPSLIGASERFGQATTGVNAVSEAHDHLLGATCSVPYPTTHQDRQLRGTEICAAARGAEGGWHARSPWPAG